MIQASSAATSGLSSSPVVQEDLSGFTLFLSASAAGVALAAAGLLAGDTAPIVIMILLLLLLLQMDFEASYDDRT